MYSYMLLLIADIRQFRNVKGSNQVRISDIWHLHIACILLLFIFGYFINSH